MKSKTSILFFMFFSSIINVQSIVNTESLQTKSDSTFVFTTSFDENYTTGNIGLMELNSASQLALKKERNLVCLFFNYEFISQDNQINSSDYTSQFRYSYSLKNNSIYSFSNDKKRILKYYLVLVTIQDSINDEKQKWSSKSNRIKLEENDVKNQLKLYQSKFKFKHTVKILIKNML